MAAAAELPDVRFVHVGKWLDDAIDELRPRATDNVEFTGWVSDEELHDWYRRAAVYVQVSRHEGSASPWRRPCLRAACPSSWT